LVDAGFSVAIPRDYNPKGVWKSSKLEPMAHFQYDWSLLVWLRLYIIGGIEACPADTVPESIQLEREAPVGYTIP